MLNPFFTLYLQCEWERERRGGHTTFLWEKLEHSPPKKLVSLKHVFATLKNVDVSNMIKPVWVSECVCLCAWGGKGAGQLK